MTDKTKVKDRAAKLRAQMESATQIGSTHEAEAFAAVLNRLLVEHELSLDDVEYAARVKDEPIVERRVDLERHAIEKKHLRIAWQESLARIVARANMCSFLVRTRSNIITFVGTASHTEVAEYMYTTLVRNAQRMAEEGYGKRWHELLKTCAHCKGPRVGHFKDADGKLYCDHPVDAQTDEALNRTFKSSVTGARGYIASFLDTFVNRVAERLKEERRAILREEAERTGGVAYAEDVADMKAGLPLPPTEAQATGLMRIDQALRRTQAYVAEKYSKKSIRGLDPGMGSNEMGRKDGRAAADGVAFTKGVAGRAPKQIGGGQ